MITLVWQIEQKGEKVNITVKGDGSGTTTKAEAEMVLLLQQKVQELMGPTDTGVFHTRLVPKKE